MKRYIWLLEAPSPSKIKFLLLFFEWGHYTGCRTFFPILMLKFEVLGGVLANIVARVKQNIALYCYIS